MVNDVALTLIIAVSGFILSVATSMFVSGTRWGRVESQLQDLQQDRVRQSDLTVIRTQLSRIDGMFTLTIKSEDRS